MEDLITAGPGGPRLGDLIFWIGTPLIFIGALGLSFLRSLGFSILRRRFLAHHGFVPSPGTGGETRRRLKALPHDPHLEAQIVRPMQAAIDGAVVECFTRYRRGAAAFSGHARVFLLRLPGQAFAPCLLSLRPPEHGAGGRLARLQGVAFALSADRPDDLVPLPSHRLLRDAGLLAAWGPRGSDLQTLIDPLLLEELLGLGRHGVRLVRCHGEDCALEIPLGYEGDFETLWAPLQRIVRLCAGGRPARQAS
jgi:hypothetical protein